MHRILSLGLATLISVLSSAATAADINVGSWNVKRLGHGNQQSYEALAAVASKFDIIALQEVMTIDGLDRLERAIETASGQPWSRLESHLVGSKNYKEAYAILFRDSTIEYDEGAVVYLDRGNRFIREPFSAKFKVKADQTAFALSTVHVLYGKGVDDRTPEIIALADYWQWLGEVYPATELIMVGDFNLPPSHAAWAPLKQYAKPLITTGASTLSGKDGRFANLYDNIFVSRQSKLAVSRAGIVNYPKLIGWNHEKSRKHVSDHAPVYLSLGTGAKSTSKAGLSAAATPVQQPAASMLASASGSIAGFAKKAQSGGSTTGDQTYAGAVRGNRNSKIWHRPDCPSYEMISQKNRVEFQSSDAAVAAGYRIAGNCR